MIEYLPQIEDILESARVRISDLRPSEWAEQNIIMPKPFPGPLKYTLTPYTREIIDRFAPDDPAREIAIMGAAQWGKTASVIIPSIGYIIANDPGNIIMTVGHEDLIDDAMNKIDAMIDGAGLRKLIRPSAQRAKSQKTGDTNTRKEFPNGFFKISSASNPKIWRQVDYKFGLIDDYEAVKGASKVAGSTRDLIQKRFTAYHSTRKILYVSSPELEDNSNILEVYRMGDQRKFMVPCPCCGAAIELKWSTNGKNGDVAGITWRVDDENKLVRESVGYICQECGDFFTDQNKSDWVNKGYWEPTAKPFKPDFYSYHMSSLYSPHGMSDWEHYVYKWIECNPVGQPRNEIKYQTFVNLDLGEPYKKEAESLKANELQRNIRPYEVGSIPEELSIKDGNGRIILITCACDLNGKLEDARLDYEVVAHSETGSTYSIEHGSIGTFIPNESGKKYKQDRERFTYEHNKHNSVWPILDEIIKKYSTFGNKRRPVPVAIDTGYLDKQVWEYVDKSNWVIRGVKGDKEDKYVRFGIDKSHFKRSQERPEKLYILQVGLIKDDLADYVNLKWDEGNQATQPAGFMNFPTPSNGKYLYSNYFEHYEAESRELISKDGETPMFRWAKTKANAQNHLFDCRVYNLAIRDIFVSEVAKSLKLKDFYWSDYVKLALGK